MKTLTINGQDLEIDHVYQVATDKDIRVKIDDAVVDKIKRSRQFVEQLVEQDQVVYGVTTGFGSFKDKPISRDRIEQLQTNLIRSHAIGTGRPFTEAEVRAAILIRANSLIKGYSGIRLTAIHKLLEILNKGMHPYVPQKGSVGSSGDLAPLSHLILVLMGEGELIYQGKRVPTQDMLNVYDFEPIQLKAKEGLAFNNGTSFLTAIAALNIKRVKSLIKWSDISLAMSLEALRGTLAAYDERVHQVRPHTGQIEVAAEINDLCIGSQLVGPNNDYKNIQDSYALRCAPQVHGVLRDSLQHAKEIVEIEINSTTDNPLIFAEDREAISAGHFHGEPISSVMDSLAIAVTELANITERRIAKMVDPATNNGLPAFLIPPEQAGISSGYMIAQYTAASLVAENKVLSHSVAVDSIPTSANQEDYVSFGTIASRKCRDIITNTENIVAIELMCAAQGLDFRRPKKPGASIETVYQQIRQQVPFLDQDRVLYSDLEKIVKLVRSW